MIKRRFILSLCAMLALSSLCFSLVTAQTARKASSPPTLNQILDHYESALGGDKAWDKLTTRVLKATMTFSPSGQEASVVVYQQFPNKYLNVTALPPKGRTELGFNGEVGWSKDSVRGIARL